MHRCVRCNKHVWPWQRVRHWSWRGVQQVAHAECWHEWQDANRIARRLDTYTRPTFEAEAWEE